MSLWDKNKVVVFIPAACLYVIFCSDAFAEQRLIAPIKNQNTYNYLIKKEIQKRISF